MMTGKSVATVVSSRYVSCQGCMRVLRVRQERARRRLFDAAGAEIAARPVVAGVAFDANDAVGARGVYEGFLIERDAHVRRAVGTGVEEEQISGPHLVGVHLAADQELLAHLAWQRA